MPNQANKSKDKSGIVQKKKNPTMPPTDKQSTEGKAAKNAKKGDTGSSAKEKGKSASGDTSRE